MHPLSSPALIAAALFIAAQPLSGATTLLDDAFGDGAIGTNPGIGGGFTYVDNGAGAGTVTESGGLARIEEGSGSSTVGIHSSNAYDLSGSGLTYSTTWEVANVNFGASGGIERIFLSLQSNDSFLFAGDAEESRVLVEINAGSNNAYLRYQNRSGGINSNFTTDLFDLGSFGGDTDGFTATLTLDSSGFSFSTTGLDATNQANITDTWANLGTTFTTALGTDGPMHVAAYLQDTGTTGSSLDIDRITLTSVPEPGVALLGALGALMFIRRRR